MRELEVSRLIAGFVQQPLMYNDVSMKSTTFEIWDTDTANVVSDFRTEAAALAYVRQTVLQSGCDAVETWELVRVPKQGDAESVAMGGVLADLAAGIVPAQSQ